MTNFKEKDNIMYSRAGAVTGLILSVLTVNAQSTDPTRTIQGISNQLTSLLTTVGIDIAVVVVAFIGIKYVMSNDAQKTKSASDWLMRVVLGIGLLVLRAVLVNYTVSVFSQFA